MQWKLKARGESYDSAISNNQYFKLMGLTCKLIVAVDECKCRPKDEQLGARTCDCAIPERAIQPEVPFVNPAALTQSRCVGTPPLPEQIELHPDQRSLIHEPLIH